MIITVFQTSKNSCLFQFVMCQATIYKLYVMWICVVCEQFSANGGMRLVQYQDVTLEFVGKYLVFYNAFFIWESLY